MTRVGELTNRFEVLGDTLSDVRATALDIAGVGLAALDPEVATQRAVTRDGDHLVVDGRRHSLSNREVHIVGAGKASLAIARAIVSLVGDALAGGLIVAHRAPQQGLGGGVVVIEADHPVPTGRSLAAGEGLMDFARATSDGDLVIACFTGGSSALASIPAAGITSSEKVMMNELLLASGLDIVEMNTVRKHMSALKGGRLAKEMAGAVIVNLTVSDVAGNHLDAITDPTVQDTTTPDDAIAILRRSGLWASTPANVRGHLESRPVVPDLSAVDIQTVVLASGNDACQAMRRRAESLGYSAQIESTVWSGEAADNGRSLGERALACLRSEAVVDRPAVLVACGGESTVTLDDWAGSVGHGGPNQEFALAVASAIAGHDDIAVVALDTDGRDGGTDWAGAVVDGTTAGRLGRERLDAALTTHAATSALEAGGDLIRSGHTGTNVNDLYVAVIGRV